MRFSQTKSKETHEWGQYVQITEVVTTASIVRTVRNSREEPCHQPQPRRWRQYFHPKCSQFYELHIWSYFILIGPKNIPATEL
ncbi:hypothetical protein L798_00788 [Zootermopsis nevadensis]|uniref:Uncharacterized protein n=1 Tax=Zootermopsis nevadensis TaxID=136037 RepID=A0A067QVB3_ZOONE|nr:hypothetical protein L798_00788 [Zootermopsis nevadensis]